MQYINEPDSKAKTYKELVDFVIQHGIDPSRAYIYLAGLGIRGDLTRKMQDGFGGYGTPTKMAIKGDTGLINELSVCDKCHSIIIK